MRAATVLRSVICRTLAAALTALAVLSAVAPAPVFAADSDQQVKTVRVGWLVNNEGFQDGTPGERLSGWGYEYLQTLSYYTPGWRYEYVSGTFTELLDMLEAGENGDTMSKSKGNVVPPSSVIEPYGADTMRLAILFIAPPEKDFDWDPKAVEGANRFIKRAWRIVWQLVQSGDANVAFDKSVLDETAMKLYRERHRTIAKCTEDFDRGQFNTAISAVMELVNAASAYLNATEGTARDKALCYGVAKDIVSVLAPICPFWADELWHEALGCEGNAYTAAWPEFDLAESIEDTVQIVVQVLGKVRGRIDVAREASNEEMQAAAEEAVAKWLEGKTVVKAICVPGKLVNLVVK